MNASLKVLKDESIRLERLIRVKRTFLRLPINILTEKEIKETNRMVQDFSFRLDRLFASYTEEKEQQKTLNVSSLTKEKDKIIEEQFADIHNKESEIKQSVEFLTNEFNKIIQEEMSNFSLSPSSNYLDDSTSQSHSSASVSVVDEGENLNVNKLFLNSIVTTNDVKILNKKKFLGEERAYMLEIFGLTELFPTSLSKQLILVDYYMNCYNFCLREKFTLQQISTTLSIFYFMFSYAFISGNISSDKALNVFNDILDFHSLNRPPFSHEIFQNEEKEKIYNFGKQTFFKNFSLFENIYRYEVSICFVSRDYRSIPNKNLNPISNYKLTNENLKNSGELPESIKKMIEEKEGKKGRRQSMFRNSIAEVNQEEKREEELEDEAQLERLKQFVSSFKAASSQLEQIRKAQDDIKNKKLAENEALQAKGYLEQKIPEMEKEITDKVNVCTKNTVKPADDELEERAKGGKK